MSARTITTTTGEQVTASDVLTTQDDWNPPQPPPVADYPCDQFLTLRPCTDQAGYGVCGQCAKSGLS